jgi:hypothetical protein
MYVLKYQNETPHFVHYFKVFLIKRKERGFIVLLFKNLPSTAQKQATAKCLR